MGKYRTNHQLEQENFTLRKQVSILKARLVLLREERDAARTALHNYNFAEAAKEIERERFLPGTGW